MELVPVVRLLWRRRLPLAAGLLVAAVLAFVGGRTSAPSSGVASTRVSLDTPKSMLVDTTPAGATTLAWRAALLPHLGARRARGPARGSGGGGRRGRRGPRAPRRSRRPACRRRSRAGRPRRALLDPEERLR